jgi:hypothetical protein
MSNYNTAKTNSNACSIRTFYEHVTLSDKQDCVVKSNFKKDFLQTFLYSDSYISDRYKEVVSNK